MMKNSITTATLTVLSAVVLSFGACKETELPVPSTTPPAPTGSQQTPVPGTADPSDSGKPPVGHTPEIPSVPGQLRRITWAPLDFKEFAYNDAGRLVGYNRQYNSVQGTDIVRRDEYTYAYDAGGKLTRLTGKDGLRTAYTYQGDVWSEALTLDKLGRPLKKYRFEFNAAKQLTAYDEYAVGLEGNVTPRSKTTFAYDAAGNLTRYIQSWYVESSGSFVRSIDLKFSNFDNRKYPKNADSFDPILQPLTFFVNNPGRKEFIGGYSPVELYGYTYDAYGYPVSRRTSYIYDKPIPAVEAVFAY